MTPPEEGEGDREGDVSYKAVAESFKARGNDALAEGDVQGAIKLYSQAIDMDPDNHIYYSNRAAAHMAADSISKSLRDAERCVALAPGWAKGYGRLGAAQHGLRRFDAAIATYKTGIEIDPTSDALWRALRMAEEAQQGERAARHRADAAERAALLNFHPARAPAPVKAPASAPDELDSFFSEISAGQTEKEAACTPADTAAPVAGLSASAETKAEARDDDLLSSFFTEVTATAAAAGAARAELAPKADLTGKYAQQDLGTAMEQHERLTAGNYQWRNLNPYETLQLGIDATVEDIKQRYKKLSSKVHPDKLRGVPLAREGFEEVKNAYLKLMDEQQRNTIIMNIEYVVDEAEKERKRLLNKGVKESTLPTLAEDIRARLLKHFADIEFKRRKSEQNIHAHNSREKMFEDMEKEKQEAFEVFDKDWSEGDRREKRVGNWRDFQTDPEAKRVKSSSYKEEARGADGMKFGQVKVETWKKSWK